MSIKICEFTYLDLCEHILISQQQIIHAVCNIESVLPIVVSILPVKLPHTEHELDELIHVEKFFSNYIFDHEDSYSRHMINFI